MCVLCVLDTLHVCQPPWVLPFHLRLMHVVLGFSAMHVTNSGLSVGDLCV